MPTLLENGAVGVSISHGRPRAALALPAAGISSGALPVVLLLTVHIPLALLMKVSPMVGTGHSLAVLACGLWAAVSGRVRYVAYISAYIAGSEVLWRMTDSFVIWEFSKYSVSAMLLLTVLSRQLSAPLMPLAYFGLLLISVPLTFAGMPFDDARKLVSMNLSGPLSLALSAWLLSCMRFTRKELQHLFLLIIAPVIGVGSLAIFSMATKTVTFTAASNHVTSGGFGPNQVSAVLGLAAMLCLLIIGLADSRRYMLRLLLACLAIVLTAQSMMTFSRGGVYIAGGSILAGLVLAVRSARLRLTLLLVPSVIGLILYFVVIPWMDAFTQGALGERFQQTTTTNRFDIAMGDLEVWFDNFLLGVGPGMSTFLHLDWTVAPHTEFTRLLAEHGVPGLLSLLLLGGMSLQVWFTSRVPWERSLKVSLLAWALLFLLGNAMRIVAPSLLFGLALARFDDDSPLPDRGVLPP